MQADFCDQSCPHVHGANDCKHEGHLCGCPHSGDYDFDFTWPEEIEAAEILPLLSAFVTNLRPDFSISEIEAALERWWRGENRALRHALEKHHTRVCERGRGFLVNRMTGKVVRARCKSWRDCEYCAWVYGQNVQRRMSRIRGLRAFVVFTMPPELGDWTNRDHIRAQARAMRRLAERLFRRFEHRFAMVWTREHNTHGDGPGRLHLNVLWDEHWVDQGWLSEISSACGFGSIVHIARVNPGSVREATTYATKCLWYATKDLSGQCDWPKGTRRYGASRKAREQMGRPERNPDWYWSPIDPPRVPVAADEVARAKATLAEGKRYWLLPDRFLPTREALAERQPRAAPSPPIQRSWPLHTRLGEGFPEKEKASDF